jgi:hypothetical protein
VRVPGKIAVVMNIKKIERMGLRLRGGRTLQVRVYGERETERKRARESEKERERERTVTQRHARRLTCGRPSTCACADAFSGSVPNPAL